MENWRDVPGYEGLYQVSDKGNVKACEKVDRRGGHRKEKLLKPYKHNKGYLGLNLRKSGQIIKHYVHRLVWETFNGSIPEGMQVNHINEDKTDNRLENLNLMTPKENINWGTGILRRKQTKTNRKGKVVLQKDLNGDVLHIWPSTNEIERVLKYSHSFISAVCRGVYRTGYGYMWEYKKSLPEKQAGSIWS